MLQLAFIIIEIFLPKLENVLRGVIEVPATEYRLTLGKTLQPPQNNPDYVKHPLELVTSLHCLVAMVTLNSRWQRKSGTCAQVFFFFFVFSSSNHQSRQLFLPVSSLLLFSTCHFSISLFSVYTIHPSFGSLKKTAKIGTTTETEDKESAVM